MVCFHFLPPDSFRVADVISDVMSTILFLLLLSYSITIAALLISLQLLNTLTVASFGLVIAVVNILTQILIYCAFSENMTHDLLATGDIFYNSPWYRLSVTLQKLYVLSILRPQRKFRLSGLGIIECSLGVFASVGVFSSYSHLTTKSPQAKVLVFSSNIDYTNGVFIFPFVEKPKLDLCKRNRSFPEEYWNLPRKMVFFTYSVKNKGTPCFIQYISRILA